MTNPIIEYWPNGIKKSEDYILNNKYHRDPSKGPARIRYDENGKILIKVYWLNNKVHNPYGPSYCDHELDIFFWDFNGIEYTNGVNEYLDKHGYKWQDMTQIDFDIMWTCIL